MAEPELTTTPTTTTRRKSYREIQHDIDQIGRMLAAGMIDREIMEQLNLKKTQYYAYRAKLYQESGQLFDRTTDDELIHQKNILQERFVRLFRRLEIDLNQGDINNASRPALYLAGQNIATNIFKIQYEGLKALKRNGLPTGTNGYLRPAVSAGSAAASDKISVLPRYTAAGSGTAEALRTQGKSSDQNKVVDESTVY